MLAKNSLASFVVTAAPSEVLQGTLLACGMVAAGGRNATEKEEVDEKDDVRELD